ncbi:MAG TPA: hypothetical protein VLS90_00345, partial [Thermodesulfobacteriota bacterium]|nr:hypothetical protein [Thermodesulfobacteriota bacterium]
ESGVSVTPVSEVVNLGRYGGGPMTATLTYRVDSNGSVAVLVEASDLHRVQGSRVDPTRVDPIALNTSAGIRLRPASGDSEWFSGQKLAFEAAGLAGGVPLYKTEIARLGGPKRNLDDNVVVQVAWNNRNPYVAPGSYEGVVRLLAMALPD